jgi:acyl-CoA synthetase (AMP-forming)/AMP-acid ligase II
LNDRTEPGSAISLPELLKRIGASFPDHVALTAPGRTGLSYRALAAHTESVQAALSAFGLGRDDRVALVLPNGPETAAAFLAVAGHAVCAPLNPGYRADEFDFYLSDLGVNALIVEAGDDSAARAVAHSRGIDVIELTPRLEAAAGVFSLQGRGRRAADSRSVRGEDFALLLHTSGTTSRPKLVPLSHHNLCASALNVGRTLKLSSDDCCLNVMPLFHIHGLVACLLSSLAAGARVVCAPDFSAPRFFQSLNESRSTWYSAVPTIHQAILAHVRENADVIAGHGLRFIRSSSATLPASVMAELEAVFRVPVIEAYGMTEAAHQMASNPLPPGIRKPGSVGKAAGPHIAILDEAGNVLLPAQTGEVAIRGANVTPGYANNLDANRSAFANGWFRTGDQGYLDADGYLFLTGRFKEIINRAGEKISPREVDDMLMTHPAIAQAVTFAVPHALLGEDVAAAVVPKKGTSVSEREIREFLFERLADFKVPSQIIIAEEIPRGPTGKLQRIGLYAKVAEQLKRPHVAPRTAVETAITAMFVEVLGIGDFGVDDNFFALGGDSLRGIQVALRINAMFDLELSVAVIFRRPTVAQLSEEVATLVHDDDARWAMKNLSAERSERVFASDEDEL